MRTKCSEKKPKAEVLRSLESGTSSVGVYILAKMIGKIIGQKYTAIARSW